MKVNAVNTQINRPKNGNLRAAARGAAITAGILGTSEGISWIFCSKAMKNSVAKCGGMQNYLKGFAKLVGVYTLIGAAANAVMNAAANKMLDKKPPKAAN